MKNVTDAASRKSDDVHLIFFCLLSEQDKILAKIVGNTTDYFKILDHDDKTILVGAR